MSTLPTKTVGALSILATVVAALFLAASVRAQTTATQALLTWQAQNFFPSDFQGKAIPTANARVIVSLAGLRNGGFVDLSKTPIRWYLDARAAAFGVGLTDFAFTTEKQRGDFQYVRASIEWSGTAAQDISIQVPVTDSFVVIGGVSPNDLLAPGTDITLEAFPYFFNVASLDELNFFWTLNGAHITETFGNAVTLTVPNGDSASGSSFAASVIAQGKRDLVEYGTGSIHAGISL
jgi:hypothetical protein